MRHRLGWSKYVGRMARARLKDVHGACGTGWAGVSTCVWLGGRMYMGRVAQLGWSKYMWCVAQARLEV